MNLIIYALLFRENSTMHIAEAANRICNFIQYLAKSNEAEKALPSSSKCLSMVCKNEKLIILTTNGNVQSPQLAVCVLL